MRGIAPLAALALLAACQTIEDSDWVGGRLGTPFNQAERTCHDQQEFVAEKDKRPHFFTECMAAFGWTPKAGAATPG
jgi:hypothetical protein